MQQKTNFCFDVQKKKKDIFQRIRDKVRQKAQYTKQGRKPWSQITVSIPADKFESEEKDMAVISAFLNDNVKSRKSSFFASAASPITDNHYGGKTLQLWGNDVIQWFGLNPETTKPADKYIHPVQYDTGARESSKIKKMKAKGLVPPDDLVRRANQKQSASLHETHDLNYHWSTFEECQVIFKSKQPHRQKNQLQVIVKVRTYYLGNGDPSRHGGFMNYSTNGLEDMDPSSPAFKALERIQNSLFS